MEEKKGPSYVVYQSQQADPECTVEDPREAEGVLFGSPTRYGKLPGTRERGEAPTVLLRLR